MNRKASLLAIIALFVLLVSTVRALQITVDGNPSDWTPEASVATSPPIPGNPLPGSDISELFFTNNSNNFYWRIDTYADPQWYLNDGHLIQICMNTDNDTNTGATTLPGCNVSPSSNFGFDYLIIIRAVGSSQPSIESYFCTNADCNTPGRTAQVGYSGTVTEIGGPLADLNISGCTSSSDCLIPVIVNSSSLNPAFNDWITDPDVTFNVAVPGPTAVSLDTFSADSSSISQLAILLIIGLAAVSLYIYAKRSQKR